MTGRQTSFPVRAKPELGQGAMMLKSCWPWSASVSSARPVRGSSRVAAGRSVWAVKVRRTRRVERNPLRGHTLCRTLNVCGEGDPRFLSTKYEANLRRIPSIISGEPEVRDRRGFWHVQKRKGPSPACRPPSPPRGEGSAGSVAGDGPKRSTRRSRTPSPHRGECCGERLFTDSAPTTTPIHLSGHCPTYVANT